MREEGPFKKNSDKRLLKFKGIDYKAVRFRKVTGRRCCLCLKIVWDS